jgi:hypothetical protein
MKFMVIASLAFASLSAQAITLKTCVLTNSQKGSKFTSSRTFYVANGRSNFIQAGEFTKLQISVPSVGQNADVWVNEQHQFIFKGDLSKGIYESAYERGTIQCDAGKQVPFIYQSRPGGVTEGPGSVLALGSCYAGDSLAAIEDLSKLTNVSTRAMTVDAATGTITLSKIERQCVEGRGTNPDDYVCDKYGNVRATYKIENCDYDPTARP